MSRAWSVLAAAAAAFSGANLIAAADADACGCFTPPDPSVPVVQAGERILFAMDSGKITAHIQIQYAGDADEFGWILPLPSVPTLELGTDELFNQLINSTQPKYRLTTVFDGNCSGRGVFGSSDQDEGGNPSTPTSGGGRGNVVVVQDSIGPYDYAVLRADSKQEMLKWLDDNRYFVPAGTDGAVGPYIRQGAYFLALKLRSGKSAGDLQPVVVKYASDLPMIPIVLTSVAAQRDMGIQAWLLGQGRAIPRNYYHTVLNDAHIDWFNFGANYNDVIIKATKEADGRHTFVTEYAGTSSIMRDLLDPPGRFGAQAELAATTTPTAFVGYLNGRGFPIFTQQNVPPFGQTALYTSQLLAILGRHIPVPAPLLAREGFTAAEFYQNIDYYLGAFRQQNPAIFADWALDFRPVEMAAEIWSRVVEPTLAAAALFEKYPYLTRLYTTLSPEEMNRDPVFSENRSLPDVSNVHVATLTIHCGPFGVEDVSKAPATLKTEQGWVTEYPDGAPRGNPVPFTPPPLPASQQIEVVTEEGAPQAVVDNRPAIREYFDTGCQVAPGARGRSPLALALLGLALVGMVRALRPRSR